MCIFCGGQCGGIGEFLISIGLPFLGLYFLRVKTFLIKIINKIISRGSCAEEIQDGAIKFGEDRKIRLQGTDLKQIGLLAFKSSAKRPAIFPIEKTILIRQDNLEKGKPQGVKGWLLLLALTLSVIIPASYLYQLNVTLTLISSPTTRAFLLICNELSIYFYIIFIVAMVFLAIFSFYAGLRLWELKHNAVKIAKTFLLTQLTLIVVIVIIRPVMTFPWGGNGSFGDIIRSITSFIINSITPSLNHFSLTLGKKVIYFPLPHISLELLSVLILIWYLYLNNSSRVRNTYSEIKKENSHQIAHQIDT
jgi:hypothetical protein